MLATKGTRQGKLMCMITTRNTKSFPQYKPQNISELNRRFCTCLSGRGDDTGWLRIKLSCGDSWKEILKCILFISNKYSQSSELCNYNKKQNKKPPKNKI